MIRAIITSSILTLYTCASSQALDPKLTGFKLVASSRMSGDFEGADFDKIVKLDNGMEFRFNEYYYHYSYRPKVFIYFMTLSTTDQKRIGIKNPTSPLNLYRLYIDNRVYKVFRVR